MNSRGPYDLPENLRQRAEDLLAGRQVSFKKLSVEEVTRLTHELQVHQIELELQNEELRRVQLELGEARDLYADLYDFAPVAYVTTDGDGRIVSANLTAAGLLGLQRGEILGTPLSDFIARHDQDTLYLHHREVCARGYLRSCELAMIKATGETFPAQLDSVVSPNPDGGFDHCRTVITDVTERVRAEQAMAEIRHRESLEVLAAGIAHDFNNLLTAVMAAHCLATMDLTAPDQLSVHLGVMNQGLTAIRDLVHQLLTLSCPTPTDKSLLATKDLVKRGCRLAVPAGNVECDYGLAEGLWPVIANEEAICRTIQKLVTNAGEAMPSGGLIRITADNQVILSGQVAGLRPGHYVRISVADAGPGIPEEHLPRLFDPYFSTKTRGVQRGVGLGLSLCNAIVTEHGGTITVESRVGAGTTFHVYLPAPTERPSPTRGKKRGDGKLISGVGRILVMDDQPMVRSATSSMLRQLGYTPVTACDGLEAVELYGEALEKGERFDAVILDLTVPQGMGGKVAVVELLAIDPEAIVLISSGYTQDPIVTDYAAHGFRGALPKPYDLAELGHMLHVVLREA